MEKTVTFPDRVDDLSGLFLELRKRGFQVLNVGADERGTYVYLDESEERDPSDLVRLWSSKPAPPMTKEAVMKRLKEFKELEKFEKFEKEKEFEPQPKPRSLIGRLFKRIF